MILGMGVGIVLTCVLLFPFYKKEPSPAEIEKKARNMGMIYEDEIRGFPQNEKGENDK
ncbi:hypothetical protein [Garciella nitratireducens]|uniref:Uncharacterized protein n=1 Tax=Garciella nitratireducens DSM 15102 TaxID=1121911 RepID=A0A1T4LCH8_9FIRM|nr:hypothetical protein [Garciella nitratireducens]RBP46745.1 hypothetical protein DFR81_101140 [Garciella nitratireducens]SJZ52400.1 hypothetical protein SAMN02745973_00895 [Garciella nitratireducens DSM 15102]